jgi:SAM-dependent methyltransferase
MIEDMDLAPTERFSSRAEAYARARPGYPREILALLERECGLKPTWRVADIGSGTGLLARLFLGFGCEVFGVEPNVEMRAAGERELRGEPRFRSVDGRAEATELASGEFDLATAGQAFHWFEPEGTRAEFRRILRPDGWVVLAWNERRHTPGFMADYDVVQNRFAVERPHPGEAEFDAFFGHGEWRMATIPNPLPLNEETLLRRVESCSRSPLPGDERYAAMMAELRRVFRAYALEGHIVMEYETRVYWARNFVSG